MVYKKDQLLLYLFGESEIAEFLFDISSGFRVIASLEGLLDGRIAINGLVSIYYFARSCRIENCSRCLIDIHCIS